MDIKEIKKAKESYGLTCREISEASGVPMSTVLKVFSGNNKNPRRDTIMKLAGGISKLIGEEPSADIDNMDLYRGRRRAEEEKIIRSRKQGQFTIEDLEGMPEDVRYEICDGKLIKMEAPTTIHQLLAAEIYLQIRNYIIKHAGKCIPYIAPLDVQFDDEGKDVFKPDVFIVCSDEFEPGRVYGAPDLIIEIISPASKKYDMQTKLSKYAEYDVREYWIVDPYKEKVVVHELEKGDISLYPFDAKIPVGIYSGRLKIDFKAMPDYIKSSYRKA